MILVEAPVSVSYQAVKRGKDSKSMTVVSFFVYTRRRNSFGFLAEAMSQF